MRSIESELIIQAVSDLVIKTNIKLGPSEVASLKKSLTEEESEAGRDILNQLHQNMEIAAQKNIPLCQDTGVAVFFVEMGSELQIKGSTLEEAINEGVRQGYEQGYLRKSMVTDPLFVRKNTKDNTPAVIHLKLIAGDSLNIKFAPKGGGSENMSSLKMLRPADGKEGVKQFVLDVCESAGPNPCPPLVIGVGIGGTMEKAAILAKKAIFRPLGAKHSDPQYRALEEEILTAVNELGIGPMGLGGRVTALAVHIEHYPCHIASLPCAVNLNCHAARHGEINL